MIEIYNLTKTYKNIEVLNIKYLHFKKGKLYLLCGANGSGKSTLVKSILKIIDYNGKIVINTKNIGFLPERFPEVSSISGLSLLQGLKISENGDFISYFASYFNLDLSKSISKLSKGNLQKVMIVASLVNNPSLLILDEPLNGLDPFNQKNFIALLKSFKTEDKCMIITTHYPKYYDGIYDEIIYLEKGKINENIKDI